MVSTVVHAGFAVLLAVGLLDDRFDRRALAVLLVAVVAPDADSFLGPLMSGAHRTVGHTLVIPAVVALLLYYDTRVRETSLVRDRLSSRQIAVAWAALFAHVFAAVALDWVHFDGVNVLWPLRDQFLLLDGEVLLSTADGFVQTFVDLRVDPETGTRTVDAGATGTTETVHVNNPVEPRDPDEAIEEPVERIFPVASAGWRLYLVGTGLFVLAARRLQDRAPRNDGA
ncbi:metal-dependent hydrolase [Halorubrum sp. Boch-26]|uniref:metal-dependent hydrolase n=1 Tax=Halorubrum sp. Boch-26 TaxID=2994426 RepID=UPI00246858AD|nr:metal-dependent hydrolase [Halorubrum sp. Boch-26]